MKFVRFAKQLITDVTESDISVDMRELETVISDSLKFELIVTAGRNPQMQYDKLEA